MGVLPLELYQLRYFKTIAETEHFTRAAEVLHVAQPSLSKAISNLEAELGVQLFDRGKRSVYLNDYGRAFLRRVEHILTELEEAELELKDMAEGGTPGHCRYGAVLLSAGPCSFQGTPAGRPGLCLAE